jgi:hypothetical protein
MLASIAGSPLPTQYPRISSRVAGEQSLSGFDCNCRSFPADRDLCVSHRATLTPGRTVGGYFDHVFSAREYVTKGMAGNGRPVLSVTASSQLASLLFIRFCI